MNDMTPTVFVPPLPPTTRAADGMPRRSFTVAEVETMQEAGIIGPEERFELIGGEIVPMQAKGGRHEAIKLELNRHFQRLVPDDLHIAQETTLRLDERNFVEPDFCVFPRRIFPADLRGHHVSLAVEIADSSLDYDLGRKIGIYAAFGVPEVWVIDAKRVTTRVHRKLGAEGFGEVFDAGADANVACVRVPVIAMRLAVFGLSPL